MTKFKYIIWNNGRQYLTNSVEEHTSSPSYNGESLAIEMAPHDGWYDENGRRCATSYGSTVFLRDWQYSREYNGKVLMSVADLAMHPWYTHPRCIRMMDVAQGTIASVSPDGIWEANIRWDEKGAEVTLFGKEWVNIIR